ncbi:MAG: hypothetical protein ACOX1F_07615 [Erysipelotrichaceae bacterium]
MILISSLIVIVIGLFNSFKKRIILSIFVIGLLPLFSDKRNRFFTSLIIVVFVILSYPVENRYFENGKVVEIRDNYYLVSNGLNKIILYSTKELSLDDKVKVCQQVKDVNYYDNFNLSSYKDYCLANNIIGSVSTNDIKIIAESFSIRKFFYEKCKAGSNKWVLQLLFKNSMEIESDKKFLISQSSLHISFFVSFLNSILSFFFYEKKSNRIIFILVLLLGFFFNFPYGYVRVLIGLTMLYFIDDRRKRLAFEILILAFYKPYYIKSVSFLIPVGIKLINCFLKEKKILLIYLYIIIVQLLFYGHIDIVSVLGFSFLKSIFGFVYLFALLVCFLPFSFNLDRIILQLLEWIDKFPKIELTGCFNSALLFFIVFLIIRYLETLKNKYLISLIMLLFVNNNRSIFSPVYTITYLDQTTPNMIQRISGIFERKPLISKEI